MHLHAPPHGRAGKRAAVILRQVVEGDDSRPPAAALDADATIERRESDRSALAARRDAHWVYPVVAQGTPPIALAVGGSRRNALTVEFPRIGDEAA